MLLPVKASELGILSACIHRANLIHNDDEMMEYNGKCIVCEIAH
jgi:hypothetical protein